MELNERILQFVQRTVRPHWLLGRTVAGLIGVLVLIFLSLVLIRIVIQPGDCPTVDLRTIANQPVKVTIACRASNSMTEFAIGVIDHLAAGLIVACVSVFMLWFVSPKQQIEEDIAALEAWNIREALHMPLSYTKNYWFRGRSGRFIRSTVMPSLHGAGARESQVRNLFMLLPNPADATTLADYAFYRNSLASERREWTVEMIQAEIFATILSAARLSNGNHFFKARVFLKSDFALFRLDMSDDRLVMTREDPSWPAIICSGRSKFYASYHEEFRNETENATELDLSKAAVPTHLTQVDVNPLITALGVQVQLTNKGCDAVIDAMNHPTLPYA
jgi:hypothetical protein